MPDLPPSYHEATGSTVGKAPKRSDSNIPSEHRRSMEDESRPLPIGWVRSYDPNTSHQFFVDTTADPPRSTWCHPYDDEQYLSTLPAHERESLQSMHRNPTKTDIITMDTDEEDHAGPSSSAELPPRPTKGKQGAFGRRLKDKLTGTTHEQREKERQQRQREEDEAYRRHLHIRQAMSMAEQTGQPQFIGKDRNGQDVYLEPSYGVGGYRRPGMMINPYQQGMYASPNTRFIRPQGPYQRGYGYGYGGGMGLPIMGGLLGGAMLGGLLF